MDAMRWFVAAVETTSEGPAWSVALAILAGLVGVAPLAVWVSSELDRRSDLRQLERMKDVVGSTTEGSASRKATEDAIDRMGAQLAMKKLAQPCKVLFRFSIIAFVTSGGMAVALIGGAIFSGKVDLAGSWLAIALVGVFHFVGIVCSGARTNFQTQWLHKEYWKRFGEPLPFSQEPHGALKL